MNPRRCNSAVAAAGARSLAPLLKTTKTSRRRALAPDRRGNMRQPGGFPAFGPPACTAGPAVQGRGGITVLAPGLAAHQPRTGKISSEIGHRREIRRVAKHGGAVVLSRQRQVVRRRKTGMAHVQNMAQSLGVHPVRQQRQKCAKVGGRRSPVPGCAAVLPDKSCRATVRKPIRLCQRGSRQDGLQGFSRCAFLQR